jgi:Sulfotransferase family
MRVDRRVDLDNRKLRAMSDPLRKPMSATRCGIRSPPPPPRCPAGWRAGPPDFVGVGAQRCGTTRWFDLVTGHPNVLAPPGTRKELHYFDRFHAGGFTAVDQAAYREYFPRPDGQVIGEWTPLYLAAPWVPRMLAAAAPDALLLVLVRDPVERYLSGLQRHQRMALAAGEPLSAMAPLEAFARGLYGGQLARLLGYFDRSRVLVQQYERCTRDPLVELGRTYRFLGLPVSEIEPNLDAHPNRQLEKPELHCDARRALIEAYTEDVARLIGAFPEIDVGLWPNFAHMAA